MLNQSKRGRAIAIAAAPNFVVRLMLQNPRDFIAGLIAAAAVTAIIANAMFLQAGRHPSPLFGTNAFSQSPTAVPSVLPRPRPLDAGPAADKPLDSRMLDAKPVQMKATPKPVETKANESKAAESRASDAAVMPKPDGAGAKGDRMAAAARAPVAPPAAVAVPRPPAAVPVRSDPLGDFINSSYRVAWVQRALSENGAGQLKPTGMLGPETQAAIARFERERKLPVTGQLSDRLLRELAIATGRPLG